MVTETDARARFSSTATLSRRDRKALYAIMQDEAGETRGRKLSRRERKLERKRAEAGRLGWDFPGGGKAVQIRPGAEFRGPTVQVCGLYPFNIGSTLALIGAPLGQHLETGRGMVCADPASYFAMGLINNPSGFVLGRPGVGKSSIGRRIATYLMIKGILPMFLSDWKPDYVALVKQLKGQVISVDRFEHFVNPLDPGPLARRLLDLPDSVRARVLAEARGRRMNVMEGLCALALGSDLEAHERSILSRAMEVWDTENPDVVPVIQNILEIVISRHEKLRVVAQDAGDDLKYDARAQRLIDALNSLNGGDEAFGRVFAEPTTEELRLDCAVVFDLSELAGMDQKLQAGVQLVCWTYGSMAVSAAKTLADAGKATRRTYLLIMDELWRALRAAPFMVDRVNEISKLNRTMNLAQLLTTHTMNDLKVYDEQQTAKAWELVSNSEMVYLGGLNPGEMGNLETVFALSEEEKKILTNWAQIGEANPNTGAVGAPRGRGKFLLKVGKKAGIPFGVDFMPIEQESGIHNTNVAWEDQIASMRGASGLVDVGNATY